MSASSNATEVAGAFTLRQLTPAAQPCRREPQGPDTGMIVCAGFEADIDFFGSSINITLRRENPCLVQDVHVFLDKVEIPVTVEACNEATVFQPLVPAVPHRLGIFNSITSAPLVITSALIENYDVLAGDNSSVVITSSTSAPVTPSSGAGPAPTLTSGTGRSNLVAILVPAIVVPVLIIILALGFIVPWWRRRRRRQRALMAPSAAFRAENAGMLAAGEAWTPVDAKRGDTHGQPDI